MPVTYYKGGKMVKKEKVELKQREKGNSAEKDKGKEKKKGFLGMFNGGSVEIRLIDGSSLCGILRTDGYNKFDLRLENTTNGSYLIPKHAVLHIHLHEKGEKECK